MAIRAGVAVADLEFVQFHPTALHHEAMPRPLLSEALRGHGALLRDTNGERFVDEMQPRDVVSRAEMQRMIDLGADHVFLDATGLDDFDQRFPNIAAALREVGLDPASDWLPVRRRSLHLWRHRDRSAGSVHAFRPLGGRRSGVLGRARREPAGVQLAAGGHGVRARAVEAIEAGVSGPEVTGAMRGAPGSGSGEPSGGVTDAGIAGRILTLPTTWTARSNEARFAGRDESEMERAAAPPAGHCNGR